MLHDGLFDLPQASPFLPIPITIEVEGETIHFDLRAMIESTTDRGEFLTTLTVRELLQFCAAADCRAEVNNGHVFLRRRFPDRSLPSTCYLHRSGNLIVCCAFDETQPTRYEAQLVAVLRDRAEPSAE